MRALFEAALLLAAVLAQGTTAVSASASASAVPGPGEDVASAFITLELDDPEPNHGYPYLSFRLDVWASSDPCSLANVTINSQPLPAATGSLLIDLDGPVSAEEEDAIDDAIDDVDDDETNNIPGQASIEWTSACLAWLDDQEPEHRLKLRVASVRDTTVTPGANATGALLPSYDLAIRFRQSAPVRIIDVEGAASVFRFNGDNAMRSRPGRETETAESAEGPEPTETDDAAEAAELLAWQHSIVALRQHARIVQHDLRIREDYMRRRFGNASVHVCSLDSVPSFFGSILRKIGILIGHDDPDKSSGDHQSALGGSDASRPGWEEIDTSSSASDADASSSCRAANDTSPPHSHLPPPLPPPPPPYLTLPPCSSLSPPKKDAQSAESSDGAASEDAAPASSSTGSSFKDVASSLASGLRRSQTPSLNSILLYLVVLFALAFLIMTSARRFRERRGRGHGSRHAHTGEESDSDSDASSTFRERLSQRWLTFSKHFHERRSRRKERRLQRRARRESRMVHPMETATSEEQQDRFFDEAFRARLVWLVRRVLYGQDADREKLLNARQARSAAQGPANAAWGHIEAVAVPAPAPEPDLSPALGSEPGQASSSASGPPVSLEQQRELQEQQARLQFFAQQRLRDEQQLRQQHLQRMEQQVQWEREEAERQRLQQWRQRQQQREQQRQQEQQEQQEHAAGLRASSDLRTPSPTLEQEIASFRAAADVVDQIIAAEEGRVTTSRRTQATAQRQRGETKQQREARQQRQALSSLTRSSQPPRPAARSAGPSLVHQPPPPPPPPSSVVSGTLSQTATVVDTYPTSGRRNAAAVPPSQGRDYSYRQRDAIGLDSDYDETESLPPAYSETGYSAEAELTIASARIEPSTPATTVYAHDERAVAEASMVADGFQYQPGSRGYY